MTKEERKLVWQTVKPHLILCAEIIALSVLIPVGLCLLRVHP